MISTPPQLLCCLKGSQSVTCRMPIQGLLYPELPFQEAPVLDAVRHTTCRHYCRHTTASAAAEEEQQGKQQINIGGL